MIKKPIKQNINTNYRKQNNVNTQFIEKQVSKKVSFSDEPEIIDIIKNDNNLTTELIEIIKYQNSFIDMLDKNQVLNNENNDDKTDIELIQIIKSKLISLFVRITDKQYFNE